MKKIKLTPRMRKRAAIDTAKKIALEPHLARDMRRVLKQMVKDFKRSYPATQRTITPTRYQADVVGHLRDHYRKVSRVFKSSLRNEYGGKKAANRYGDEVEERVLLSLNEYILTHSETQAKIIIATTESDLSEAIDRVIRDSLAAGVSVDAKKIADLVSSDYSRKINGRADIIATTETQSIAEKTKDIELESILEEIGAPDSVFSPDGGDDADDESEGGDEDDDPESNKFARVWVSVLDERTREAHVEADGQETEPGENFNVDGEELQYPGDPEGSPENIVNCRCCAIIISKG